MVFSKENAPNTLNEFKEWYAVQVEWTEEHTYNDPAITTPELRSWLMEMVQTFPDMNGPEATSDHTNIYETDYGIGSAVIYAGSSWSLAEEANKTARRLAQKHGVGFYDPSFEEPVLIPENGKLKPMEGIDKQNFNLKKPWWKLW